MEGGWEVREAKKNKEKIINQKGKGGEEVHGGVYQICVLALSANLQYQTISISTHTQYFDYTCPPVLGLLSALMKEQWLLSAACPPSPSNLPSSALLLPSSSSASLHHRNADFRPQGLKSGWRGANYYGKENKTQGEGGRRDRESGGGGETRRRGEEEQRCCSLAREGQKKLKRDKHKKK